MLNEFFDILDECIKTNKKEYQNDYIYVDIHILNSANKIKAVMLVVGNDISQVSNTIINIF